MPRTGNDTVVSDGADVREQQYATAALAAAPMAAPQPNGAMASYAGVTHTSGEGEEEEEEGPGGEGGGGEEEEGPGGGLLLQIHE